MPFPSIFRFFILYATAKVRFSYLYSKKQKIHPGSGGDILRPKKPGGEVLRPAFFGYLFRNWQD
jgi:hypothetical protein